MAGSKEASAGWRLMLTPAAHPDQVTVSLEPDVPTASAPPAPQQSSEPCKEVAAEQGQPEEEEAVEEEAVEQLVSALVGQSFAAAVAAADLEVQERLPDEGSCEQELDVAALARNMLSAAVARDLAATSSGPEIVEAAGAGAEGEAEEGAAEVQEMAAAADEAEEPAVEDLTVVAPAVAAAVEGQQEGEDEEESSMQDGLATQEDEFDVQAFVTRALAAAAAAADAEDELRATWASHNTPNFIPINIPSEELAEMQRQAAEEEEDEEGMPEGFFERGRCMSPLEKKIKQIQEKEWGGVPFDPKPHVSRLEAEVGAARSPCRTLAREMVQTAFQNTLRSYPSSPPKSPMPGLADMPMHKSKLQQVKEAAAGQQQWEYVRRAPLAAARAEEGGLGECLKVHKSRLEREKEAALAAAAISVTVDASASAKAAVWEGPGLGDLKPHKSRLERQKEAALAATAQQAPRARCSAAAQAAGWEGVGLGDLKQHKSRLEREKEAAAAAAERQAGCPRGRAAAAQAAWEGLGGLGDLKPHKSKLQLEKEAWLAAEAKRGSRRATSNTVLSSAPSSARPTEEGELPVTFPTVASEQAA